MVAAGSFGGFGFEAFGEASAPPPGDLLVVHDAADVRLGIAVADASPVAVGARQGGLHEVFGELMVTGEEVGGPGQGRRTLHHELVERLGHAHPLGEKNASRTADG